MKAIEKIYRIFTSKTWFVGIQINTQYSVSKYKENA